MTLRQYADQTTINSVTGASDVSESIINAAESMVDIYANEVMNQFHVGNIKALNSQEYPSNQVTFGAGTLTILGNTFETNKFQFGVVELLETNGANKKGTKYPVISSNNNFLTLDGAVVGITSAVKIYQIGVFPRIKDIGQYGKSIPYQIIEAVAYQASYLASLDCEAGGAVATAEANGKKKSELIGSSYSYTNADGKTQSAGLCDTAKNLIDSIL